MLMKKHGGLSSVCRLKVFLNKASFSQFQKGPIGASKCRNPVTALCTGLPYIGNIAMLKVDGL